MNPSDAINIALLIALCADMWTRWKYRAIPCDMCLSAGQQQATGTIEVPNDELQGGRVVTSTAPPVYDPTLAKKPGGKVYKTMPRQLRKIREAQEKNE